ncbi:hypothetical protein C8F04DRAFT_1186286 [Mycena alexandri]|uniref:Uncharacterized protein n=1 Tax=Mycena alexandri TaxID=1745969 RepID=A0AAD6SN95_9AGAR|nr:hypothetical protein C8F04DRAFT_1186286 [Mycena alexandri]
MPNGRQVALTCQNTSLVLLVDIILKSASNKHAPNIGFPLFPTRMPNGRQVALTCQNTSLVLLVDIILKSASNKHAPNIGLHAVPDPNAARLKLLSENPVWPHLPLLFCALPDLARLVENGVTKSLVNGARAQAGADGQVAGGAKGAGAPLIIVQQPPTAPLTVTEFPQQRFPQQQFSQHPQPPPSSRRSLFRTPEQQPTAFEIHTPHSYHPSQLPPTVPIVIAPSGHHGSRSTSHSPHYSCGTRTFHSRGGSRLPPHTHGPRMHDPRDGSRSPPSTHGLRYPLGGSRSPPHTHGPKTHDPRHSSRSPPRTHGSHYPRGGSWSPPHTHGNAKSGNRDLRLKSHPRVNEAKVPEGVRVSLSLKFNIYAWSYQIKEEVTRPAGLRIRIMMSTILGAHNKQWGVSHSPTTPLNTLPTSVAALGSFCARGSERYQNRPRPPPHNFRGVLCAMGTAAALHTYSAPPSIPSRPRWQHWARAGVLRATGTTGVSHTSSVPPSTPFHPRWRHWAQLVPEAASGIKTGPARRTTILGACCAPRAPQLRRAPTLHPYPYPPNLVGSTGLVTVLRHRNPPHPAAAQFWGVLHATGTTASLAAVGTFCKQGAARRQNSPHPAAAQFWGMLCATGTTDVSRTSAVPPTQPPNLVGGGGARDTARNTETEIQWWMSKTEILMGLVEVAQPPEEGSEEGESFRISLH